MINIAVIDDDSGFCEEMKRRITEMYGGSEVDCYCSMEAFIGSSSEYDIAIIDILLGQNNGIEKAAAVYSKFPGINIIFVSVERDFFQEVYSVNHSYFMVKPVSDNELKKAVELCCKNIDQKRLCVKSFGKTSIIDLSAVTYFEGALKKTTAHYADASEQTLNMPLRELEEQLNNTNFVRIHQSYIANLAHMTHVSKKRLTIHNTELPISRGYSSSAADAISRYLGKKLL